MSTKKETLISTATRISQLRERRQEIVKELAQADFELAEAENELEEILDSLGESESDESKASTMDRIEELLKMMFPEAMTVAEIAEALDLDIEKARAGLSNLKKKNNSVEPIERGRWAANPPF